MSYIPSQLKNYFKNNSDNTGVLDQEPEKTSKNFDFNPYPYLKSIPSKLNLGEKKHNILQLSCKDPVTSGKPITWNISLSNSNIQLIDYCLRCDGHHVLDKKVAVFGHTTSAAWVGIMLLERYNNPSMTILTNGEIPEFDQESTDLMNRYGIKVVTEKIKSIIGDPSNKKLEAFKTLNQTIEADFAFVSLGMIVHNELAKELSAEIDQRGFVITDAKGKTSIEGLYVAGDLRANVKKQIYTAWDTAVDSADDINILIRRKKRNENKS